MRVSVKTCMRKSPGRMSTGEMQACINKLVYNPPRSLRARDKELLSVVWVLFFGLLGISGILDLERLYTFFSDNSDYRIGVVRLSRGVVSV